MHSKIVGKTGIEENKERQGGEEEKHWKLCYRKASFALVVVVIVNGVVTVAETILFYGIFIAINVTVSGLDVH